MTTINGDNLMVIDTYCCRMTGHDFLQIKLIKGENKTEDLLQSACYILLLQILFQAKQKLCSTLAEGLF